MKKTLLTLSLVASALAANAQEKVYQLPNSDFESDFVIAYKATSWGSTKTYTEPLGWHGYATIEGSVGSMGRSGEKLNAANEARPGSAGSKSVYVSCTAILGVKANGVMTTGRIYANSTTATDGSKNYNYSEPGKTDTSNNNENSSFSQPFHGHPDAMRAWVKFDAAAATQSSQFPYASCNTVITANGRYQDPEADGDYSAVKVARAHNAEIAAYGEWQLLDMPFDYEEGTTDDAQYILVTFTTNAQPGGGTAGDKLYVDDIEMVYNSELAALTVGGQDVFVAGQTHYDLSSVEYSADDIKILTNAHAATVETAYDETTAVLTITIKAEDYAVSGNAHTYTVQFKKGEPAAEGEVRNYVEDIVITINGETTEPQPANVSLTLNDNGTSSFTLRNFILWAGGEPMPVGNIYLENVATEEKDGVLFLTTEQTIVIQEGDMEDVPFWAASFLPPVPVKLQGRANDSRLYCHLDIDMTESLGQTIVVTLGSEENVPTIINRPTSSTTSSAIYNLAGQRLGRLQPGLNIVGGKKILVK